MQKEAQLFTVAWEASKGLTRMDLADNALRLLDTHAIVKNQSITFSQVAHMWVNSNQLRLKGATTNKYQTILQTHVLPQLGAYKLSDLSSTLINAYLMEKLRHGRLDGEGGLSPSYVNSIRIVITAILQFATNENLMSPLTSKIHKPNVCKKELSILTKAEQLKLESLFKA